MKKLALKCLFAMVLGLANYCHAQTITYFHNDLSGSPVAATDANGNLIWKENYAPYGSRLDNPANSTSNRVWFAGKLSDSNSGLSYMSARYYDPVLGRFLSVDPKRPDPQSPQDFNRYAYAHDNPFKYVDPDGHTPIDVGFLIYDGAKLAQSLYAGESVGEGLIAVGADLVGVVSPIPFAGEALKAARVAEHVIEVSRVAGKAREEARTAELAAEHGQEAVQREMYLRTPDGKIAKDVETGTGRRIDHVVIKDGKAVKSEETTSMTASKSAQNAKENRIRDDGGTFVKDRTTGQLVDLKDVPTDLHRRD